MNNLHFEEVMPGNLERECIEETCDSQGHDSAHWKKSEMSVGNDGTSAPNKSMLQLHRDDTFESMEKNFTRFLTITKIQASNNTMTALKSSRKVSFYEIINQDF